MGSEVEGFISFTRVGGDFEATLWVSLLEKLKPKLV